MISVVIIVKNNNNLSNTLKALLEIPKPEETEIIVVDASGRKLDKIKKDYPEIRWNYFINIKEKKITIPEQRNLGLKEARGEIVVFIDADCIPDNDWLIEIVNPIYNEGEDVVYGFIKTSGQESIWDIEKIDIYSKDYLTEASTANLAFRKSILKKVGFFDESFYYGSDTDFSWRINKN